MYVNQMSPIKCSGSVVQDSIWRSKLLDQLVKSSVEVETLGVGFELHRYSGSMIPLVGNISM